MNCKNGNSSCGQTTYRCGLCEAEDNEHAERRMSQKDHAYDTWALSGSRGQDEDEE